MLLITPTAYGTCSDIRAVAEVCHAHDRPLIVDEAWGAHYPFHPELPSWAMDAEADLCVTSVHKMGAGLEQGSVFHLRGDRVDPDVLKSREDLLGTTSPSVLVYAALDGWRRQMAEHGRELLGGALDLAREVRGRIADVPGLHPLGEELLGPRLAHEHDPLMIVVDVSELGTSGYGASDWLREQRHVNAGLADHRRVVFQINHSDDSSTADALLDALAALTKAGDELPPPAAIALPSPGGLELPSVMPPREAYFHDAEEVAIEDAEGRIGAEPASPYPPGVPVIVPGERISREAADYLRSGVEAGMLVPDTADSSVRTLRVVVEGT